MTPSTRTTAGQDTVASLRARLARLEREAAARERQLEAYAADLREVFKQERARAQELRRSYKATVLALANAVEARDAYTGRHAQRVAAYGLRIAHAAGVEVDAQVEFGFLLHDIGKVAVPDAILFKPGPLTAEEHALMTAHPTIGWEILRHIDFLDDAKTVVRHHHERWDGSGYPDGLAGEAIPLHARVFALADALDALTTDRPYRGGGELGGGARDDPRGRGHALRPGDRGRLRHDPGRGLRAHPRGDRMTPTILIVDDDPLIRKLITTTLQDVAGFDLQEAGDGLAAIEAATAIRPDIVFLDYDMPRLNGIETCRRLRSDPTTADATIIMLTAMSDQPAQERAVGAGADLFLTKPFSPLRLLRLVDELGRGAA